MHVFIVEDDCGIMGTYPISEYENENEAQVAAIDSVIEWFEDDESHDVYTDMDLIEASIKELNKYKDGVKDGEFDKDDIIEVTGFKIFVV